jgi:hypothetical protein
VLIVQLIYTPGSNRTVFQKKLKSNFIERKYSRSLLRFESNKQKENFDDLLNTYTEKVEYLIKNVRL